MFPSHDREGLLAQSVIVRLQNGEKPGYGNHSQLQRFLVSPVSHLLIGTWLTFIHKNASERGYNFNYSKILHPGKLLKLTVTSGQIEYEFKHLQDKLHVRDNKSYWINVVSRMNRKLPKVHPMFEVVGGTVESWEIVR